MRAISKRRLLDAVLHLLATGIIVYFGGWTSAVVGLLLALWCYYDGTTRWEVEHYDFDQAHDEASRG